jgi:hypothetical protein
MTENNIKASKHAIKASEQKVENRRSRRAVVSLFPDQDPGSKAGVADAKMDKMNAHVIQTPGKDQTIVDVQSGKMDGKVNLPKEVPAPVKEMTDDTKVNTNGNGTGNNQPQNVGDDLFGGVGQSLSGKGGPPGAEVSRIHPDRGVSSANMIRSPTVTTSSSSKLPKPPLLLLLPSPLLPPPPNRASALNRPLPLLLLQPLEHLPAPAPAPLLPSLLPRLNQSLRDHPLPPLPSLLPHPPNLPLRQRLLLPKLLLLLSLSLSYVLSSLSRLKLIK